LVFAAGEQSPISAALIRFWLGGLISHPSREQTCDYATTLEKYNIKFIIYVSGYAR
jgi:hypothetical protein